MREIKFRGKRTDNGEWVYGYYANWQPSADLDRLGNHWIITGLEDEQYQVDPETVGQYVGLQDSNGKDIYEGDICQLKVIKKWKDARHMQGIKAVYYDAIEATFKFTGHVPMGWGGFDKVEILGNTCETPELLQ